MFEMLFYPQHSELTQKLMDACTRAVTQRYALQGERDVQDVFKFLRETKDQRFRKVALLFFVAWERQISDSVCASYGPETQMGQVGTPAHQCSGPNEQKEAHRPFGVKQTTTSACGVGGGLFGSKSASHFNSFIAKLQEILDSVIHSSFSKVNIVQVFKYIEEQAQHQYIVGPTTYH